MLETFFLNYSTTKQFATVLLIATCFKHTENYHTCRFTNSKREVQPHSTYRCHNLMTQKQKKKKERFLHKYNLFKSNRSTR